LIGPSGAAAVDGRWSMSWRNRPRCLVIDLGSSTPTRATSSRNRAVNVLAQSVAPPAILIVIDEAHSVCLPNRRHRGVARLLRITHSG
jgi:hypothetical protein